MALDNFFTSKKKKEPITPEEAKLLKQVKEEIKNKTEEEFEEDIPQSTIEEPLQDSWEKENVNEESESIISKKSEVKIQSNPLFLEDFTKEELFYFLTELVLNDPLYPGRQAWIRDRILPNQPDITAQELASRLGVSIAVAIILLENAKKK